MGSRPVNDPPNLAARDNWDGAGGGFWATHADRFDAEVAGYQDALLAAAAIDERDTVLDVGCGNGRTTLDAARRASAGSVLGVDLSAAMLEVARRRAREAKLANASFEQADVQVHPFPRASFDLALSRNGTLFFDDPVAAFRNIGRALRPGGRLVMLVWQAFERNEWLSAVHTALAAGGEVAAPPADAPSPVALSDPDRVHSVLGAAGFSGVQLTGVTAPMWFGADPDDAFRFVTGQRAGAAQLRELDDESRAVALDALRTSLVDHHGELGVQYDSAAWLVEAHRR